MIKVKENPGLVRDPKNGAILNVDSHALREHRNKQKLVYSLEENNEKISKIENEMAEIKSLLYTLINNR